MAEASFSNSLQHFRPSTACIVSSVRDILEATGCLPRDTPTLLQYPSLDDERKRVLCRLNDLSKRAQLAGADNIADDFREVEGRKMLQSAYKLRERLETFLETAVECGVELPGGRVRVEANDEEYSGGRHARELEHTPTPASLRRFGTDVSSSTNRRLQNVFKQRDSAKLAIISDGLDERIADARNSPTSSVGSSSSLGTSPSSPSTPSSLLIDEHGRVDVIPSVRDSHERLLSILAAFIGHIHSHSSNSHPSSHAHILDVIRACIDKVRDLLSVLEAVAMHKEIIEAKPQEVKRLESLGTALYQATADLVTSAEIVAALPFTDEPSEQNEDEQAGLLSGATRTLRSAQDCVQAVIQCVSRGPGQHPFVVFLSSPGSPGSAFSHATPRSLHSIGRSLSSLSPLTMKSPVLYDDEAIEELASGDDELEDAPLGGDDEDLTVRAPEMFSRITIEEEPSRPSLDSASSSTIAGGSNRDVEEGPEVGLMSTSSSNRPLLLAERTLSTSTEGRTLFYLLSSLLALA
jgi:son of sevenless-like protein